MCKLVCHMFFLILQSTFVSSRDSLEHERNVHLSLLLLIFLNFIVTICVLMIWYGLCASNCFHAVVWFMVYSQIVVKRFDNFHNHVIYVHSF